MFSRCIRLSQNLYRRYNSPPQRPLSGSTSALPQTPQQHDAQTFKNPDNRILGYAQYGSPHGKPLLYFHGLPSSRLESAEFHPIALKHNIRLIGIDRPGIGLSTFQPNRKILDWPSDVLSLADHLDLKTFKVMGSSGGGPYALACAYALPQERLKGVGILAGSAPWEAMTKGMGFRGRILWNLWAWAPWTFRLIFEAGFVKAAKDPDTEKMYQLWDQAMSTMREKDRVLFEDERIRKFTVETLREAFVRGVDGAALESRLITRDWGFRLEDVGFEGVKMWFGDEDVNTPVYGARWMAERLRGCRLRVLEGETHYMCAKEGLAEEIFKEMMDVD